MDKNTLEYARSYITEYKKKRRWRNIVIALAVVVAVFTVYEMRTPAHTMEDKTFCGLTEHIVHDDECYETRSILICDTVECEPHIHTEDCYEIRQVLFCELPEDDTHTHGEECYKTEEILICGKEEASGHTHSPECFGTEKIIVCEKELHTHTLQCYSDPCADIETEDVMKQSVSSVKLSGSRAEDTVAIAETQLGYGESEKNYLVSGGESLHGYTRYGAWGGSPYDDWGMFFCSFCCKYAGVDSQYLTEPEYCGDIINVLIREKMFLNTDYSPHRGDIVFFSDKKDSQGNVITQNRAGIIRYVNDEENEEKSLTVIEGNRNGKVVSYNVKCDSTEIIGYCKIPVNPKEKFTLTAKSSDGVTVTVSGARQAFSYSPENLSLSVSPIKDKNAEDLINDAVANFGDGEKRYSVIENRLYDISVICTDPKTGEKKQVEPSDSLELSIDGVDIGKKADEVKVFHIDSEKGTADALSSETDEDGGVNAVTDSFSVYGVTLLGATGKGITSLSSITNSGSYYLTTDINVTSTVRLGNVNSTLDLNGHKITVSCNPMIEVSGGTLTIVNTGSNAVSETRTSETVYGKTASYNSSTGVLTYYVTETRVKDALTGATEETLVKYTVQNTGIIAGNKNGRAVVVQNGGTFNFDGGYICNFQNDSGGAVYISESNSKMNLGGGVIAGNSSNRGGGIYLNGYSTLNINSGVISGNTATGTGESDGGGGVYARSYWNTAGINMSGGYVTNNYSVCDLYQSGGGGIALEKYALLKLTGGFITSNKAMGGGGGIRTVQVWNNEEGGRVEMDGGFVTANNCIVAEGAGLNINAGGSMYMSSGYVTNNLLGTGKNDTSFVNWGGGGMFCAQDCCAVVILNSLVTNNTAGGFGGGVAGCSTGQIKSTSENGTAIFENEALGVNTSGSSSEKHEDHFYAAENEVFMSHGYQDYFCALSSNISGGMLGGGTARWEGSSDGVAVSSDSPDDIITGSSVTGLTCNATGTDKENAKAQAKSFFNGNESPTHGGGILTNGYLILGDTDKFEVYARLEITGLRKRLLTETGKEIEMQEGSFEFVVVDEYGETVSHAFNDKNGNIALDRRLPFTKAGVFTYYIYELEPNNAGIQHDTSEYKMAVTVIEDNSMGVVPWTDVPRVQYKFSNIKVTEMNTGEVVYNGDPGNDAAHAVSKNILSGRTFDNITLTSYKEDGGTPPKIYVKVTKKWDTTSQTPSSVRVTLTEDGVDKNTVTLSRSNNWTYTWSNGLSPDSVYTVREDSVNGYVPDYDFVYKYDTTTVTSDNNNGALTYKLNSRTGYFELCNSSSQFTAGSLYIISSPDGKQLLTITGSHADSALTSADTYPAERDDTNMRYIASSVPDSCRFKLESINRDGYNYNYLANQEVYSFLLSQNVNGVYLKGTNSNWYSSPIRMSNGQIQIQLCPDNWQSGNQWRYIIWSGSQFDSDTVISKITYNVVSGSHKEYTVTNTPENNVEYSLAVKKCDKEDGSKILSGAVFEIKNGGSLLKFNEISSGHYKYASNGSVTRLTTSTKGYIRISGLKAGTYTLSEVLPPYGYIASGDRTVTLSADTPGRSLEIVAENEKFVLILPQTGGIGVMAVYLAGSALLITGAFMYGIRRRHKRKEVE